MPKALKPAPTKKFVSSGASPRMKLPSGVKLSGPLMSGLTPAVACGGWRVWLPQVVCKSRAPAVPDGPRHEVVGRLAHMDPLGGRLPGAAAGGDAEGVEAGADEEVRQLRRLAEDEVAVRREAFRAVDELLDAGGLQRRHSAERQLHELLEVIEVGIQQGVVEARRYAVDRPEIGRAHV